MDILKSGGTADYAIELIDSAIAEYLVRIKLLRQAIADNDTNECLKGLYRVEAAAHQTHITNLTIMKASIQTRLAGERYGTYI